MKRIDQFEGLYGQTEKELMQSPLYSELLETRSHSFDWVVRPHIHPRRYQIFFIQHGEFEYQEAGRQRKIQPPCLLMIPPAVIHGFIFSKSARGRILSLSDTLVNSLFPGHEILAPMLNSPLCITSFPLLYPPERIYQVLENLDKELFEDLKEKELMLHIYLQELFMMIYRLWLENQETAPEGDNITLKYFRKFQQEIREKEGKASVSALAASVGVSTVHLNRICRQVARKPARELIQEYILEEAKKYLTYTSYMVSEIAYLLGFDYPNYFARFFKKQTDLSPVEYRKTGGNTKNDY